MKKTKIRILLDDAYATPRYRRGEKGYIDGYVIDKNGTPLAAVIIKNRLVFLQPYAFKVIRRLW